MDTTTPLSPTDAQRLIDIHNRTHSATDARILYTEPGLGLDAGHDASELIITVEYTARIHGYTEPGACRDCNALWFAHGGENIQDDGSCADGYSGSFDCGAHVTFRANAQAVYALLNGEFVLWMN